MKIFCLLILFFGLFIFDASAQFSKSKHYSQEGGFCSTTILADSLGNFYKEEGCEGRSHISFGTYKLKDDRIYFSFQRFDSLSPIYSINESNVARDSDITVTILTRQGLPILNQYFSFDAIDSSGKFFQTLQIDQKGQVLVNAKKNRELRFDYLENIYRKKIRIPIGNKDLIVILNLPQFFFKYPRPSPESNKNFSMVIKKDGFYDITGKYKIYSLEN